MAKRLGARKERSIARDLFISLASAETRFSPKSGVKEGESKSKTTEAGYFQASLLCGLMLAKKLVLKRNPQKR